MNTKVKSKPTFLDNDIQKALEELPTTSSKIRYLTSLGMTRSHIANILNIRYQHVRNVQITPLKKTSDK